MRVWIFNQYAISPDQAGGTRHYDLSKKLVAHGHQVSIFAGSIHYINLNETKNYYGKQYLIEKINGVEFVRIKTIPYRGSNAKRVWNMIDFMRGAKRVALSMEDEKPDVIIGSSVHLFAALAGYRVAKKLRVPFVLEIRDLWPQTLIDMGVSRWHPFVLLLGRIEKFLYRRAKKVITLLPGSIDYIADRGAKKENIVWISNGIDLARYDSVPDVFPENKKFRILYTGSISNAHAMDTVLEAAKILMQKNIEVEFYLVGGGTQKTGIMELAKKMELNNVLFPDQVPKDEVVHLMRSADALLFTLEDSDVFKYGISSNKLFDYLISGRPIIFSCNTPFNPVEEAGAGISVTARSPLKLADVILELKNMSIDDRRKMGENGKKYVRENHSMDLLAEKLETVLKSVISQ